LQVLFFVSSAYRLQKSASVLAAAFLLLEFQPSTSGVPFAAFGATHARDVPGGM
jgi:hypothetical protein